jgi:hypothetical protein
LMGSHEHIWFHQYQEDINSLYHFERIPRDIPGAYVSLESEIIRYIKYHVNPETDKIQIKISGQKLVEFQTLSCCPFLLLPMIWHYHQQIKMFFAL